MGVEKYHVVHILVDSNRDETMCGATFKSAPESGKLKLCSECYLATIRHPDFTKKIYTKE